MSVKFCSLSLSLSLPLFMKVVFEGSEEDENGGGRRKMRFDGTTHISFC
jgi:hypothetical protein